MDFDERANFVIGGLIDRTVVRFASLEQSAAQEIQARRLPIEEHYDCKLVKSAALSINQVAMILQGYRETRDWAKVLAECIPKRWRAERTS